MSKRSVFGKTAVLILVAAMAVFLIILSTTRESSTTEIQTLPVKTANVQKGDLEKLFRISGFIESETMVTVLPHIGGTLTELYMEMGDAVEKDQIIARIDSIPYQLSFNQAKAAFTAAESTYKRVENLFASKNVSQQNYDEAKANYDALRSLYELAELNLGYTALRSPVSGVVLEKHVSRGSMVAPQVPVVTIGDINNLKVNAGVPEIHYSFFQKHKDDMEVKITVPALDNNVFKGSISNIAPYIKPQSRNFVVKCTIIDNEVLLRPGMFVYMDFILEKRVDTFYLPYKALIDGDSIWYVDETGKARRLSFTPSFGNEEYFEIPAEILADIIAVKFIIEGQNFLSEGQPVRILGDS